MINNNLSLCAIYKALSTLNISLRACGRGKKQYQRVSARETCVWQSRGTVLREGGREVVEVGGGGPRALRSVQEPLFLHR